MESNVIREPAVAGMFYPGDRKTLVSQIQSLLEKADFSEREHGEILGAIVPHAGYVYSGPVAAYTYSALQKMHPKRIVIVGPSHREYFHGCSVYNGDAVRTPLGDISVEKSLSMKLAEYDGIEYSQRGHLQEHAIEVQIPFLQYIYKHPFSLIMITMGEQSVQTVQQLATALSENQSDDLLILASSDLSHYYHYDKAVAMDSRFEELLEQYDIEGLWRALDRHEIEACGFGPVLTLLEVGKAVTSPHIQIYKCQNSGDVTGERRQVVGYLAAGVYRAT